MKSNMKDLEKQVNTDVDDDTATTDNTSRVFFIHSHLALKLKIIMMDKQKPILAPEDQ